MMSRELPELVAKPLDCPGTGSIPVAPFVAVETKDIEVSHEEKTDLTMGIVLPLLQHQCRTLEQLGPKDW